MPLCGLFLQGDYLHEGHNPAPSLKYSLFEKGKTIFQGLQCLMHPDAPSLPKERLRTVSH